MGLSLGCGSPFRLRGQLACSCSVFMAGAAALAGGTWCAFAGYLKARRNVNEITPTLMLTQSPSTPWITSSTVPEGSRESRFSHDLAPFPHCGETCRSFPTAGCIWVSFRRGLRCFAPHRFSVDEMGFEVRVIGANPKAAQYGE
jgi:hypothetical protein